MDNIIFFQSRGELEAAKSLEQFIDHCRNLPLYEDQGGLSAEKWIYNHKGRPIPMLFSIYTEENNPYEYELLSEPFLLFGKCYIRYKQSIRQVTSISNSLVALRLLHDALLEVHGEANVLKTDGLVIGKVRELADVRHATSNLIYRIGQQIDLLYKFLREKGIVPTLPAWKNPWKRGKAKSTGTDKDSRKWQQERCPSLHQMIALAECFAKAVTPKDIYWSSVVTLLMFAPNRAGELFFLTVDCLHFTDSGRLAIRWYGEKGYGHTLKWVPEILREFVVEAHRRLVEIGAPARAAAKYAHDHPVECDAKSPWANDYRGLYWPNLPGTDRPIWDALLLIREWEFHMERAPKSSTWKLPTVNEINWQLAPRPGQKNPAKTLFQRMGQVDEDGSAIAMTSHEIRVWLSTSAERAGMDSWMLAKWAARARIQDNRHYDLRTPAERDEMARQILGLSVRPTALEAIKLNLPVSYEDLGLHRMGIADVTEWGMCTWDYAMSPCMKSGECMTCKSHACIKGMPKTLERIRQLEKRVESQFEKAKLDAGDGTFGADRWVTHLGWKLAHIRTQRERIESEETPIGAVLWIDPEHDPSPIKRSLEQRSYSIKPDADRTVDSAKLVALLEASDA